MPKISLKIKMSVVLSALLLGACAQGPTAEDCQELDWYEIGRQDGSRGFQEHKEREIKVVCESSDPSLSEALYHNGFDAGISHTCQPENGYQLGYENRTVRPEICPPLMRDDFSQNYKHGQEARQLKAQKKELDLRLQDLETALNNPKIDRIRRGILKGEKLEIEAKQKEIEKSLSARN